MVWLMFEGHFFTTNHANITSQEHNDTRAETLVEVESSLCFSSFLLRFLCLFHQLLSKVFTVRLVGWSFSPFVNQHLIVTVC